LELGGPLLHRKFEFAEPVGVATMPVDSDSVGEYSPFFAANVEIRDVLARAQRQHSRVVAPPPTR